MQDIGRRFTMAMGKCPISQRNRGKPTRLSGNEAWNLSQTRFGKGKSFELAKSYECDSTVDSCAFVAG